MLIFLRFLTFPIYFPALDGDANKPWTPYCGRSRFCLLLISVNNNAIR